MANGNAYPAVMLDPDGNPDSAGVTLQFTDSADQPGSGGGGLDVSGTPDEVTDVTQIVVGDGLAVTEIAPGIAGLDTDFSSVAFVNVQTGAPDPIDTFVTPLIYDNTPVTGGLYAWDQSSYQQVGNVVA